jgi:hypothetical protein
MIMLARMILRLDPLPCAFFAVLFGDLATCFLEIKGRLGWALHCVGAVTWNGGGIHRSNDAKEVTRVGDERFLLQFWWHQTPASPMVHVSTLPLETPQSDFFP